MKLLLTLGAVGLLLAASLWERKETSRLGSENEALRAVKAEAEQLATENRGRAKLEANAVDPGMRVDKTELLRLRNEMRQLRAQLDETDKLRAANARLSAEIKAGPVAPRRITDLEGTVPREQWKHAGMATPEATVQSFFAAVASGNPEELIRYATPQGQEQFRKQMERDPDRFRQEFMQEFGKIAQVAGYRIQRIRPRGGSEDQVEVLIQVAAEGATMPLPLRRIGQEWRLGD